MNRNIVVAAIMILAVSASLQSCSSEAGASPDTNTASEPVAVASYTPSAEWNAYWYQGVAEVNSYKVSQGRYTMSHEGTCVNIFVTEDFSKEKLVKLNDAGRAGADRLPILKLNQSLKFNTGIYPYSVMMSAFQPVDRNNYPHAVKVTNTVQEWCGMAYMQAKMSGTQVGIEQFSYFEGEQDQSYAFDGTFMEDELWTTIRLFPDELPQGEMLVVPGTTFLRFSHKPVRPYTAKISVSKADGVRVLKIEYPELSRDMEISFEDVFPYKILGWEEDYLGFNGEKLHTEAKLDKTIMIDYWNKHNNDERSLRKDLGLPEDWQ
ncbi:MAG: hypothetical protein R2767_01765 [Chitinophagales bacterium]|nr:hypothetical protein [Chitinophagales bacterium]HAE14517.1 hypothetical protein [Bacteroidota bacterium]MCB9019488.1 hypothetical protein [Chitinophagales bacterium]HAE36030.1 hypothetical protein [Bacteroidota bacterium]HPE97733.1 hypothetical protein [Chitinophagales bacterium]